MVEIETLFSIEDDYRFPEINQRYTRKRFSKFFGRYDSYLGKIYVYMKRHAQAENPIVELDKTSVHELIHDHQIKDEKLVESLTCILTDDDGKHEFYKNDVDLQFLLVNLP